MTGNEYQKLAMRTNDGESTNRLDDKLDQFDFFRGADPNGRGKKDLGELLNGVLGLTGEAGEVSDMIKKWIFHQKEMDIEHLKKEIGDVMWYIAMICESMDFNLDEILQMNVDKLKARYPMGFDVELANNRKEGDV